MIRIVPCRLPKNDAILNSRFQSFTNEMKFIKLLKLRKTENTQAKPNKFPPTNFN